MKGNKIDDLFRSGLKSHKIAPPSTAWDKIESQLPNQSKKGVYFWISIAATILLIFAFGWIALDKQGNGQNTDNVLQTAENTPKESIIKTPQEEDKTESQVVTPKVPQKQLMASNTQSTPAVQPATIRAKKMETPEPDPSTVISEQEAPQLGEIPKEVVLKDLEMILPKTAKTPSFFIVDQVVREDFIKDFSIDVQAFVASHHVELAEPAAKRKKFSLLNGIVSVAKGVNNGKLAFSEMRKSKNDFFNNDLKYGSKEAESEDMEDDLDEK